MPEDALKPMGRQNLEKELKRFGEGLPYDRDRIIEKTQKALKIGVMAYFEAGCGMILLHDNEGDTYTPILEQYFPGVSPDVAKRWRKFARAMAGHPQFRAFIEERGGYSKALTMLETCAADELEEFEVSGELRGYSREEIFRMSVRTLQKALLRAGEKAKQMVEKATEKLSQTNAGLKEEVDTLKAALSDEDLEAAQKLLDKAGKKVNDALNLLRQIPWELLARDGFMRQAAFAVLSQVKGSAEFLEVEIADLANPDPAATVRRHMARLRSQAEGEGAEQARS